MNSINAKPSPARPLRALRQLGCALCIDLLPALPPHLDDGEVTGLVARPGVVVDLQWRDRRPHRLTLRARTPHAAGTYSVVHDGTPRTVTVPAEGTLVVRFSDA